MGSILSAVLLTSIGAHIVLLVFLQLNRIPTRLRPGWLQLALLGSLLAAALPFFLPSMTLPVWASQGLLEALLLMLLLIAYGQYMLSDVLNRRTFLWLLFGGIWLLALLAAAIAAPPVSIGQPAWMVNLLTAPDAAGLVLLAGLGAASIGLLAAAFYGFYAALLPEVANRALFWVINSAIVTIGIVLFISGVEALRAVAALVLLTGLGAAAYAHISYRVFDIRSGLVAVIRAALAVLVVSGVILAALLVADNVADDETRPLTLVALAVLAALLYVLLRRFALLIFRQYFSRKVSPTRAARQYSQQVSRAVELTDLLAVSSETVNRVMDVLRSGMMLVNDTGSDPNRVEIVILKASGLDTKGFIAKDGPIYEHLAVKKLPLTQFDVAFDPRFGGVEPAERQFFDSLQMSAYAPIVVENALIGILMCGPKKNDAPFNNGDLELLATMADQTGVALRNSRAMADLKHLNATMQALNKELEEANQQYEKLDSVKTDFITIASHELRTPLAQIRGYTDILDALNEQGMLDQEQISGMVANLRKATERTEELLSAMLDMSQLDVNAMDLRFAEAAPESVLRMAIEPLTEHIKQRRLTLSARGLRALPAIHCDMQRLVQAFRNIITNAIKFTPDGGRIDITASLQPGQNGADDHILVMISDTGVGINEEDLELIFEKFYRAYDPSLHSTGAYKFMGAGPGLGLTIARGVIESHGGKVWAESSGHNMETCPGSIFYVLLPINPPEDARRVAIEDSQAFRNPTPARRPVA